MVFAHTSCASIRFLVSLPLLAFLVAAPFSPARAQETDSALDTPDPFLGWRKGALVLWDGTTAHSLMKYSYENALAGAVVIFKGYLFYLDGTALKQRDLDTSKTKTIDPQVIDAEYRSGYLNIDHEAFTVVYEGQGPRRTDCTEEPYCSLDDEVNEVVMTREIRIRVQESNYVHMPFPRDRLCQWDGQLFEGFGTHLQAQATKSRWVLEARIGGNIVTVASTKNPIPIDCRNDPNFSGNTFEMHCNQNSRAPSAICSLFSLPCDQRAFGKCISVDLRKGRGDIYHEGIGIEGFECPVGNSPSGCWTSGSSGQVVGPTHFREDIRFIHWIR